jgi:hemolysin-activating ACP:hemolysin acyltransferase
MSMGRARARPVQQLIAPDIFSHRFEEMVMSNDATHLNGGSPAQDGTDTASPAGIAPQEPAADPQQLARVAEQRQRLQAGVGEVALAMMALTRYRDQSLADLRHLVVDPISRDRIAIAKAHRDGRPDETAGIAIWASVSEAVDAKIRAQINTRVFPVRLKAEDWTSGDIPWLLDVIAPSQQAATAVLANFRQVVKDRPVHVHPLVGQLVDREALGKMLATVEPQPEAQPSET